LFLSRVLGGLFLAVTALLSSDTGRLAPGARFLSAPSEPVVAADTVAPVVSVSATGAATDHIAEAGNMVEAKDVPVGLPTASTDSTPIASVTASAVSPVAPLPIPSVLTGDTVRQLLRDAGAPESWVEALVAIAYAESRWSPGAVGDGGNSLGLYQLWTGWFAAAGEDLAQWADPAVSTRVALYVRSQRGRFGGPGGWSVAAGLGLE
jgi:hypothetical protein